MTRISSEDKFIALGSGFTSAYLPPFSKRWKDFFLVRNRGDVVTRLPPRISGYCHVGTPIEIGAAGKYSPINAHRPENYIRELAALEEY